MNLIIILISLFSVKWNCIEKQYFDGSGRPLSGGKLYFYMAGTDVPVSVYHDAGVTPMTNPVVLDASGHTKMCGDMERAYSVNIMDMYDVLTWQTGFNGPSYYFAGTISYDTIYLALKIDTIIRQNTIVKRDTIKIIRTDTIYEKDTVYENTKYVHDTLALTELHHVFDTLTIIQHDTVLTKISDTLRLIDTVKSISHDTVNTCLDGTFARYVEKLFNAIGTSTVASPITIENVASNSPSVEVETNVDVNVEVYIYDNLGVSIASETYQVKAASSKQYVSFNGYSKNGVKVPNGVYLMRIVSGHNNMISNNVYQVGIHNRVAE